jgi:large subunit ribosomal protein L18
MNELAKKNHQLAQRKGRVRAVVSGTADRPRLSIHISNKHIVAQVINDETAKTLAFITTVGAKEATGTMTEKATWVGAQIAKAATKAKVTKVAFDRGGKRYHGRIKALAEEARKQGLEF